nr:hypothetical protein [Tanacetum cinerariifolium]
MSTLVFVDLEISTQADEAQSTRVPVPFLKDLYEAIRTARMVVRVSPAMSLGLSTSMAEVAAMSESAFRKRFRSSYESLPSSSPPDLPLRKHYRDMSELVEDDDEDEEIEESLDSESVSEDAEDEGPTTEDEDPTTGDDGLAARDEGPGRGVESYSSDDEIRGLDDEGHSVESDGLGLGEEDEATNGSLSISPSPSIVPSPISSPMISLTVPSSVATPTTDETEGFLTELGAQVEMQEGLIRNHVVRLEELSPALFKRSNRKEIDREWSQRVLERVMVINWET